MSVRSTSVISGYVRLFNEQRSSLRTRSGILLPGLANLSKLKKIILLCTLSVRDAGACCPGITDNNKEWLKQEKTLHRNMRAAGLVAAVFLMTLLTNACDGDSGGKSYMPASSRNLETTTEMPPRSTLRLSWVT
jgi:hypothetical protein